MINNQKIELEKIFLTTKNPRTEHIDLGITGDYFRKHQDNSNDSQTNTIIDILSYEGDLSDMKDLIESLKNGYNAKLPKPFVIQNNDSFIVIEGNRRILALKLLNGIIKMPDEKSFKKIANDEIYIEKYYFNNDDSKKNFNYKKIKDMILDYEKSDILEFDVSYIKEKTDDEDEEIKIAIFSNHITGKMNGKRNWNRGKTLSLYLSFMKDKTIDDKNQIQEIASLLNRSMDDVQKNLKSAFLIKDIIKQAGEDEKEYFISQKVSSLEKQFIKKFVNADGFNHFDQFIKIENNKFVSNSKNSQDFCKFIIKSHRSNILSTRVSNSESIINHPIYKEFVYGARQKEG